MIVYWHPHVVRLSVRLSVCNSVHCGSQGQCTGLKVVPVCSQFLFDHSDTFAVQCMEETANVIFLARQSGVHWSCYVLLFTDLVNY